MITDFRRSLPIGSALRPAKREAVATRRCERLPSVGTAFAQQQCTYIRPAAGQWTDCIFLRDFLRSFAFFLLAFFPSPHLAQPMGMDEEGVDDGDGDGFTATTPNL